VLVFGRAGQEGGLSVSRSLLREPILHFFLIGAAIFLVYAWVDESEPAGDTRVIAVSEQDAARLAGQFEATWKRPPTVDELDGMIEDHVRDEIYVREALTLGLDRDDPVVRQRLRQKMEFLTETGWDVANPSEAVLLAHLQDKADRFRVAPLIGFRQILLGEDGADPAAILAELAAEADPTRLGQRTLLPAAMRPSPAVAVNGTFGDGFFEELAALSPGRWAGPVRSGYGAHLVWVETVEEGGLPELWAIRDKVERDWRAEKAAELRAARLEALRDQYVIETPEAARVLSQ
jgi:hypothetical protein